VSRPEKTEIVERVTRYQSRPGETLDTLLGGKLGILQGKKGYRASLDAVLLAGFAKIHGATRVLDLGTGNGSIALMLAALHPAAQIVGLEIQKPMVNRARRSVCLNRLERRVEIIHGDVRLIREALKPESFDVVVSNPPYRAPRSGRVNPDVEKRVARHEVHGALMDFLRAGGYVLRRGGALFVVYPAARAIDLLVGMRHESVEPKRLRLVHSFRGRSASLVLVEGVKGGGQELEIMPPLVVYTSEKQYADEVRALLRK
jgi:tRNA1Val (adenine37-N6)-methyltransferase